MGKNILLISPEFFNFDKEIKKELENIGNNVWFYNDKFSNSKLSKIIYRLDARLVEKKTKRYYSQILADLADTPLDVLIVIKGEAVPEWFIEEIKLKNINIKTVLYLYDSITLYNFNNKNKIFDKYVTFDNVEAKDFGWFFLPLYYSNQIQIIREQSKDLVYDYSFIATLHSDRARVISKIEEKMMEGNFQKSFIHLYIPLKLMFFYEKLVKRKYRELSYNDVNTTSINNHQMVEVIKKSNVIIDIHHPTQNGLTARTFEAIGAGRKLITTNKNIRNYDFYNSNNVLVIDKNDIQIPKDWMEKEYIPLSSEIYDKYTINSFVCQLIDFEGE